MRINKVFLHSTYACNVDCVHCAVPKGDATMPFDLYKKIVDTCASAGSEYLIVGGGEPLMHPDISQMIAYGADAGLKMKIETNGKILTRETLDTFRPHLFQLNVSLDGKLPSTHNSIRGAAIFENTIAMIQYAREIGIDVAIWSVVMKHNIDELKELIPLAKDLGVDKLSFLYATPVAQCFRNKDDILVGPEEYNAFFQEVSCAKNDLQMRIAPYLIPPGKEEETRSIDRDILNTDCLIYEKEVLHIDPTGDLYPCVLLLHHPQHRLGTATDTHTLTSIISGDKTAWDPIITTLTRQRAAAQAGQQKTGCLGLCESHQTSSDPRFGNGTPLCPCRTVCKEWNYTTDTPS